MLALMDRPWRFLAVGYVVPYFVRDAVYDLIGSNRYSLFGKSDTCRAPTPEFEARFMDPEAP